MQSIGAAILLLSALVTPTPSPQPLQLETVITASAVTFRVVGLSSKPVHARYALKVIAGTGNRSTHAGSVTLLPDARVTVSTISVSVAPGGTWSATLQVDPDDEAAYAITRESAAS